MLRFNALGDCLVYDPAVAADAAGADPEQGEEGRVRATWAALATQRELKRRYYMVQRARDAQVLGAWRGGKEECEG
jgi:hypothetical protein